LDSDLSNRSVESTMLHSFGHLVTVGDTHHYTTEDQHDNFRKICFDVANYETNSSRFLQIPRSKGFMSSTVAVHVCYGSTRNSFFTGRYRPRGHQTHQSLQVSFLAFLQLLDGKMSLIL